VHGEHDAKRNAGGENERQGLPTDLLAYYEEIGILERGPKGTPNGFESEVTQLAKKPEKSLESRDRLPLPANSGP
jgi:hypothetical protein